MRGMPSPAQAEELAREMLGPLGDRWAHVQAVAARAEELTPALAPDDERHLLGRRGVVARPRLRRRAPRHWMPREDSAVTDALWTADMTTGPRGEALDYPARLAEIIRRYPADSVVGRAMQRAEPAIRGAIERTRRRMPDTYPI